MKRIAARPDWLSRRRRSRLCGLDLTARKSPMASPLPSPPASTTTPDPGLASSSTQIVRFGLFEADLRARELRKRGVKVRLPDQPFQVLQLLLEHPGDVVTREELRQRLWSADTFVDFDLSLNSAVRKLREALGDSADHSTFIDTLPRRGYRFIASVERPSLSGGRRAGYRILAASPPKPGSPPLGSDGPVRAAHWGAHNSEWLDWFRPDASAYSLYRSAAVSESDRRRRTRVLRRRHDRLADH